MLEQLHATFNWKLNIYIILSNYKYILKIIEVVINVLVNKLLFISKQPVVIIEYCRLKKEALRLKKTSKTQVINIDKLLRL